MKTIYFDIGNVLCFFNPNRILEGLSLCCQIPKERAKEILLSSNLQSQYERGQINLLQAHHIFQDTGRVQCSLEAFQHALTDIFTPNEEIWPLVHMLNQKGHRLILLSNTCETHFQWLQKHYPILQIFDDQILSFEVGYTKPDPQIFLAALKKANCPPSNCFYIDDIPTFVESAKKVGLDSEVFTNTLSLKASLQKRNLI